MTNLDNIFESIAEIQQPRSRFQIENFVVGQHATKEMQYYQVCIEIQDMTYKLELASIERESMILEYEALKAEGSPRSDLEARKILLNLKQQEFALVGAKRELEVLISIWNSFEIKYSREQIEAAQKEYWEKRLTAQAKLQALGQGFVDTSHMESLSQVGILDRFMGEIKSMAENAKAEQID